MYNLFCDWLSVTVNIDDIKLQNHLVNKMKCNHAVRSNYYNYFLKIPVNGQSIDYLNYSDDIVNYLRIWVSPKRKGYNFMKIEFNPSKVKMSMVSEAINTFVDPYVSYQYLMKQSKVTRIDLSIDVENLQIENAMFYISYKSVTETLKYHHIKSKSGYTEKLGSSNSKEQWVIYDKRSHLKKRNKLLDTPLTRIEWRYKPKNLFFKDIHSIKNPFEKLKVYRFKNMNSEDKMLKAILKLAKYEGLNKAIRSLTDTQYEKKKYLGILNKLCKVSWWTPYKAWENFPNVINGILQGK